MYQNKGLNKKIWLITGIIVLLLCHTTAWYYRSDLLKKEIEHTISRASKDGAIKYSSIQLIGFPLRAGIKINDYELHNDRNLSPYIDGIDLKSGSVEIFSNVYSFKDYKANIIGKILSSTKVDGVITSTIVEEYTQDNPIAMTFGFTKVMLEDDLKEYSLIKLKEDLAYFTLSLKDVKEVGIKSNVVVASYGYIGLELVKDKNKVDLFHANIRIKDMMNDLDPVLEGVAASYNVTLAKSGIKYKVDSYDLNADLYFGNAKDWSLNIGVKSLSKDLSSDSTVNALFNEQEGKISFDFESHFTATPEFDQYMKQVAKVVRAITSEIMFNKNTKENLKKTAKADKELMEKTAEKLSEVLVPSLSEFGKVGVSAKYSMDTKSIYKISNIDFAFTSDKFNAGIEGKVASIDAKGRLNKYEIIISNYPFTIVRGLKCITDALKISQEAYPSKDKDGNTRTLVTINTQNEMSDAVKVVTDLMLDLADKKDEKNMTLTIVSDEGVLPKIGGKNIDNVMDLFDVRLSKYFPQLKQEKNAKKTEVTTVKNVDGAEKDKNNSAEKEHLDAITAESNAAYQ